MMKLIIHRDQAQQKGFLGGNKGVKFNLEFKVELTDTESEFIEKYRAGSEILVTSASMGGLKTPFLTISDLVEGSSQESDNIIMLLENEEAIKKACGTFKIMLDAMATFGGEEIVEF